MNVFDAIQIVQQAGFTVLVHTDRGPDEWLVRAVCNADKVVVEVRRTAGRYAVEALEPYARATAARLASAFPNHETPPPAKVRKRRAKDAAAGDSEGKV